MAIERTLSIIKPDATKRNLTGKINAKFEEAGLRIVAQKRIHLTLAQVYQMYRQPEKAFGEYRAALRLEANEPDYHRQYGEALEQEKRYGDAQESFRKMLDTAKEDSTRLAAVAG